MIRAATPPAKWPIRAFAHHSELDVLHLRLRLAEPDGMRWKDVCTHVELGLLVGKPGPIHPDDIQHVGLHRKIEIEYGATCRSSMLQKGACRRKC